MKKAGDYAPGYALRNGWTLAARQVITTWENHTVQSKPSQRENVGVRVTARQCGCETTEAGRHRDNAVTNAGTVENPGNELTLSSGASTRLSRTLPTRQKCARW